MHRQFRQGQEVPARGRLRRSPPADMRQVVFAACQSHEVALESGGRGDFSVRAVPLLARAASLTNGAFADLVTREFGAAPKQHPNLDCAPGSEATPFLFGRSGGASAPPLRGTTATDGRAAQVADLREAVTRLLR